MYEFCCAVVRIYYKIFFRSRIYGRENVPKSGGLLICVNHLSNNDAVLVGSNIKRRLRFMAKKELFKVPLLNVIVKKLGAFPIDRSISDIGAVRTALSILKGGDAMMIFPEGRRNKEFLPEKILPGAAMIAYKSNVPILPVYIDGKYKLFGRTDVYYGKPVSPEEIGEMLKNAAENPETKNQTISNFLYGIIKGSSERLEG